MRIWIMFRALTWGLIGVVKHEHDVTRLRVILSSMHPFSKAASNNTFRPTGSGCPGAFLAQSDSVEFDSNGNFTPDAILPRRHYSRFHHQRGGQKILRARHSGQIFSQDLTMYPKTRHPVDPRVKGGLERKCSELYSSWCPSASKSRTTAADVISTSTLTRSSPNITSLSYSIMPWAVELHPKFRFQLAWFQPTPTLNINQSGSVSWFSPRCFHTRRGLGPSRSVTQTAKSIHSHSSATRRAGYPLKRGCYFVRLGMTGFEG